MESICTCTRVMDYSRSVVGMGELSGVMSMPIKLTFIQRRPVGSVMQTLVHLVFYMHHPHLIQFLCFTYILNLYLQSSLYFKCAPRKQCELLILDTELLSIRGIAVLEGKDWSSSVMFSDGENLGMITAGKDVSRKFPVLILLDFLNIFSHGNQFNNNVFFSKIG